MTPLMGNTAKQAQFPQSVRQMAEKRESLQMVSSPTKAVSGLDKETLKNNNSFRNNVRSHNHTQLENHHLPKLNIKPSPSIGGGKYDLLPTPLLCKKYQKMYVQSVQASPRGGEEDSQLMGSPSKRSQVKRIDQ